MNVKSLIERVVPGEYGRGSVARLVLYFLCLAAFYQSNMPLHASYIRSDLSNYALSPSRDQ